MIVVHRFRIVPSVVGTRIDAIVFRLGFPRLANFRAVIANRAGWIIIALAGNGIALTGNGAAVAAGHGAIPAVFSAGGNTGAVITADTRIFTAHITFRNQIGEHRANIALAAYLLSFNVFAESVRFPGPGVRSAYACIAESILESAYGSSGGIPRKADYRDIKIFKILGIFFIVKHIILLL